MRNAEMKSIHSRLGEEHKAFLANSLSEKKHYTKDWLIVTPAGDYSRQLQFGVNRGSNVRRVLLFE